MFELVVALAGIDALFVSMSETRVWTNAEVAANEYESGALLLRMTDAARVLSIGCTTMYELVAAGEIEVVRIGRSARVPVAALDEFVERRRRDGTTLRSTRGAARAERQPGPGQPTT